MNCTLFHTTYSDFADGLLEEAAVVAAHRHLSECAACRRFHLSLLRGVVTLRNGPVVRPSDGFEEQLLHRLEQEALPLAPVARQWSAAAAATLVLTVVGLFVWDLAEQTYQPGPVVRTGPVPYLSPAETASAPVWLADDSGRLAFRRSVQPIVADMDSFAPFGAPARSWQSPAVWVGR